MTMHTLEFSRLALAQAQSLADRLEGEAAAIAINETDAALGQWAVVAYFDAPDQADRMRDRLAQQGAEGLRHALPEIDWVRKSLAELAPVVAGRFYLHGSHHRDRRRPGGVSLEIDAGTAFGTGHHGTTVGCLLALDAHLKRRAPRRILDVGCGSGVLALAAARHLRRSVIAGDIDPEAVRVAKSNAWRNGVGPLVRMVRAAGVGNLIIRAAAPYDLILANILARPLIGLASSLAGALGHGGSLILSGLTPDQVPWIAAAYRNRGLALVRRRIVADWAVLVFTKQNARRKAGVSRSKRCWVQRPQTVGPMSERFKPISSRRRSSSCLS